MNREELRYETKCKVRELFDQMEDKYCDGCSELSIEPPFRGVTSCDINPWRDNYKIKCRMLTMVWTSSTDKKVQRCLECIVSDYKMTM